MSGREPIPGDLIEISRPLYEHWAIYVGDGYVIHLVPPSEVPDSGPGSIMSITSNTAVVKKETLKKAVGNNTYRINNIMDNKYFPRDIDMIIRDAEMKVGQTLQYSITSKNCEHFVTELRYGQGRAKSQQVDNAFTWGALVVGGIAAFTGAMMITNTNRRRNQ